MLRQFFGWASHPARGLCPSNPATALERPATVIEGHRSWTDEEIAQYQQFYPVGTDARRAFDLYMHTGQRGSDVIKMGWSDFRKNRIKLAVKQRKTGKEVLLPISPALARTLSLIEQPEPTADCLRPTFLRTRRGKPYTRIELTASMRRWIDAAGLPKACVPHGLRKATVRIMLEEGERPQDIAAITGQSIEVVIYYGEAYAKEKSAERAMPSLSRRLGDAA